MSATVPPVAVISIGINATVQSRKEVIVVDKEKEWSKIATLWNTYTMGDKLGEDMVNPHSLMTIIEVAFDPKKVFMQTINPQLFYQNF